jgi:hypothetical protein
MGVFVWFCQKGVDLKLRSPCLRRIFPIYCNMLYDLLWHYCPIFDLVSFRHVLHALNEAFLQPQSSQPRWSLLIFFPLFVYQVLYLPSFLRSTSLLHCLLILFFTLSGWWRRILLLLYHERGEEERATIALLCVKSKQPANKKSKRLRPRSSRTMDDCEGANSMCRAVPCRAATALLCSALLCSALLCSALLYSTLLYRTNELAALPVEQKRAVCGAALINAAFVTVGTTHMS